MQPISTYLAPVHYLVGVRDHVERALKYLARDDHASASIHAAAAVALLNKMQETIVQTTHEHE